MKTKKKSILKNKSIYGYLVLLFAFVLIPIISNSIKPREYFSPLGNSEEQIAERNESAVAQLFGEFRVGMSDILFLKTERYLHLGIAYAPHKDTNVIILDKKSGENKVDEKKTHKHSHLPSTLLETEQGNELTTSTEEASFQVKVSDDFNNVLKVQQKEIKTESPLKEEHKEKGEEVTTIIRKPESDWRGFIGNLEREVKPYRDPSLPHILSPGTELLPWYRVITLSNPHNVRGYVVGSWWLLAEKTEKTNQEALKFVDEGIMNNPKAFQLYLMKGRVFIKIGNKEDALKNFHIAEELALNERPKDGTNDPRWSLDLEEDFLFALRYEVILLRDFGKTKQALALARKGLQLVKDDKPLLNLIRQLSRKK